MTFTMQEIADLREAIDTAQGELCVDWSGDGSFPEGTAYNNRLELLKAKLLEFIND
jgi:hypothetical protein